MATLCVDNFHEIRDTRDMSRGHDGFTRYTLRIPDELYSRVKDAAGVKSVNAEIVARLEQTFQKEQRLDEELDKANALERIEKLIEQRESWAVEGMLNFLRDAKVLDYDELKRAQDDGRLDIATTMGVSRDRVAEAIEAARDQQPEIVVTDEDGEKQRWRRVVE